MSQRSSMHYTYQTKRDLKALSGFWIFRKNSVTYVTHSNDVNFYARIFFLITVITNIILSSLIYINFHTLIYFDQGPLKDLTNNFNGINTIGWLLGLAIDNFIYNMLYVFLLPLVSVSLARIFNSEASFVSGFRIACVSYIVIIVDYIIGFISEMLYNLKTGIVFAVITINRINLILIIWFFVLFTYGSSIELNFKKRNNLFLNIVAFIIAIFIAAFITVVVFKFLGIMFMWIFPLP